MKSGMLILVSKEDKLYNNSLPALIKLLFKSFKSLNNKGYNTCYINIKTKEVKEYRGKLNNGVLIKTYNCLPINNYLFSKE